MSNGVGQPDKEKFCVYWKKKRSACLKKSYNWRIHGLLYFVKGHEHGIFQKICHNYEKVFYNLLKIYNTKLKQKLQFTHKLEQFRFK